MATNKDTVQPNPTTEQANPTTEQPSEKMVKVRIPRTSKSQEDVFVSVNMKTYLIKRGVEVEVPESVAEVLRHQEEALEAIMEYENSIKH
ncbi:MAG: hypothetical protein MSS60_04940 [Clostridiales bacterium]|nr:hypothetical protein [Clostridiales bacterium]